MGDFGGGTSVQAQQRAGRGLHCEQHSQSKQRLELFAGLAAFLCSFNSFIPVSVNLSAFSQ